MLAGVLAVQWSEAESSMLDAGVAAPLFGMGARPVLSWVYARLRSGAESDEDKAALAAWQDPDLTLEDVAEWAEEQKREEQARRRRLAEMGR